MLEGEIKYTFNGRSVIVGKGESIVLPHNATYSYLIEPGKTSILQIEFDICDESGKVQLADHPVKNDDPKIVEIMERLVSKGVLPGQKEIFSLTSYVYRILGIFFDKPIDSRESFKIYPALKYLEAHYTEKIVVEQLAKLCLLGQSQFRRVFKKEIGMSPIEYKNSLRIKAACDLLSFSSQNVSEISETLGFENPYVFSKTFKKYMNISPLRYKKAQNK